MGHCWWLAIQGLSIPDEEYSPPYPEPDALPHKFSSQSYPVCPANPFLSHLASAPCYSIFLLLSAGLPTPIFGVSSRAVPSSLFLWTQPLSSVWDNPALAHTGACPVHREDFRCQDQNVWVSENLADLNRFSWKLQKALQWHEVQFLALNTSLSQGKGCYLWTFFFPRFDFRNVWNILTEFSASIRQPTLKLPAEIIEAWQSYKQLTSNS